MVVHALVVLLLAVPGFAQVEIYSSEVQGSVSPTLWLDPSAAHTSLVSIKLASTTYHQTLFSSPGSCSIFWTSIVSRNLSSFLSLPDSVSEFLESYPNPSLRHRRKRSNGSGRTTRSSSQSPSQKDGSFEGPNPSLKHMP